jgi:VanZ family protein
VTLLFTALVTWLMLAPQDLFADVPDVLDYEDKIAHGVIFLTLALLVRWSLPKTGGRGGSGAAVLALLVVYAGSIEGFQPLLTMADRQFEWLDLVSNYAGLCAGWLLMGRLVVP